MYSVYQHWDPLQVCVVGQSYPPEFFHWIENVATRNKFEKLAQETEEDFQQLIKLLQNRFGIKIHRPCFPKDLSELFVQGKWVQPPTAPRDYFLMIEDKFWVPEIPNASHAWSVFYRQHQQQGWSNYVRPEDFYVDRPELADQLQQEFKAFKIIDQAHLDTKLKFYQHIFDDVSAQGNEIVRTDLDFINGCFVSRIGQDLYFATQTYHDDKQLVLEQVNKLFPDTRNHVVNAGGHGDATYCPVTPGLIISLRDVPTYADTFPDWEVVYLPPSDYAHMSKFQASMKSNRGRWFIPGFEQDQNLINMVDHYFDEWVGQVSETVFDVNILIVDPKNIVVSAHNDQVEKACARHGIEVHVVPFRHKYFWDTGIHCITNDLSRSGTRQNFFNLRNSVK
jgi:hypothetical protein